MNPPEARFRTQKVHWHMLNRCQNPKCDSYSNYGGRGIKVCEHWQLFDHFLEDMGFAPKGLLLDRIDNDGDYEPGNCRWADRITSNSNKRGVVMLSHNGEMKTLSAWARLAGLSPQVFSSRLASGWSVADAIEIPTKRQMVDLRGKLSEAERQRDEARAELEKKELENRLLREMLQGRAT